MNDEMRTVNELLAARAEAYLLFHKLFGGAPTPELFDELMSDEARGAFEILGSESAPLSQVAPLLATLSAGDRDALVEGARGEYTRLLIGPGQPEALPWESPYVSNEAWFFQENTLVVRRAYEEAGLRARMQGHTPDDHVAIMVDFMAALGRRSVEVLREGRLNDAAELLRRQERFLTEHMLNWLPLFAESARRSKTAVLYPQMAEALSEFAKVDAVLLSEVAYWAEQTEPESSSEDGTVGETVFDAAYNRLRPLRLVGLEDSEITAL
ncbi:molecular chaperone TorD family protein [Adlercreutzia sp. R25]|uniref:TorD/DmsD family molecular chaperone n=1 Tax=Adlercreutzia shanghongiae TaxID=3111773 RepID=UPI002DBFFD8B|nr:molecular chaperone TorD family protein [Adlercreutzia sp. R25]MEC4271914.1 molecular chaperone TorD family protein [Adlercreutzia sp. R25]